jgi:hypothetical protein
VADNHVGSLREDHLQEGLDLKPGVKVGHIPPLTIARSDSSLGVGVGAHRPGASGKLVEFTKSRACQLDGQCTPKPRTEPSCSNTSGRT